MKKIISVIRLRSFSELSTAESDLEGPFGKEFLSDRLTLAIETAINHGAKYNTHGAPLRSRQNLSWGGIQKLYIEHVANSAIKSPREDLNFFKQFARVSSFLEKPYEQQTAIAAEIFVKDFPEITTVSTSVKRFNYPTGSLTHNKNSPNKGKLGTGAFKLARLANFSIGGDFSRTVSKSVIHARSEIEWDAPPRRVLCLKREAFYQQAVNWGRDIGQKTGVLTPQIYGYGEQKHGRLHNSHNRQKLADYGRKINIIMDYVPNGEIFDKYREISANLHARRFLHFRMAEFCKRLQKLGVSHRDLKKENIMNGDLDNPFVFIDFGLSLVLSTPDGFKNKDNDKAGTPGTVSPEVALGRGVESNSDIWALGVLLYETMFQTPLFGDGCVTHILKNVKLLNVMDMPQFYSIKHYIYNYFSEKFNPENLGHQLEFEKHDPFLFAIWALLQKDPKKRPNADALGSLRYFRGLNEEFKNGITPIAKKELRSFLK